MLTAIDDAISSGCSTDKFRIRVCEKVTEAFICDNEIGVGDTANPTTVIGGRSIVIHEGK